MAFLRKLSIRGYRSIKEMSLEFSRLNILIGANGAGKSNFVSFFKMMNEMMAGRLQQFIGSTGRAQSLLYLGAKVTPELEVSLEFEDDDARDTYQMKLAHAANDSIVFAEESFAQEVKSLEDRLPTMSLGSGHLETRLVKRAIESHPWRERISILRRILAGCRAYQFHDTSPTARVRQFSLIDDNRWLASDAGNLASMLYFYKNSNEVVFDRIVSTIRKVMFEFSDFVLEPDRLNPREISLNWRKGNSDYLFGPHQISDGTLRAMAIITLFLQPEADLPDVIILDEPELGLHPYALEIVAGLVRAASEKSQVLVATQSQSFLNHFDPSDVVVVEGKDGSSHFRRLEASALSEWLDDYSLGELWEKNVLGGGPIP